MMRAMVMKAFGTADVFVEEDVYCPDPAPDQMLVEVAACGVCGHDLLARQGHFPKVRLPAVLGHEIAGTVVKAGAAVRSFRAGDRVAVTQRISCGQCALCESGRENLCVSGPGFYGEGISGGYGDYVLASERNAVHVPDAISLPVAAVLSCAIGTGFHALRRADLKRGQTLLVTGASGGVGIHAIKLARLAGLVVIAVTTSAAKSAALRQAGADHIVVAPDLDFHAQVREVTGGEGVDGVLEIVGRTSLKSSIRALRIGGRIVLIGNVDPGMVEINPGLSILKEISIIGSGHATLADLKSVMAFVAEGKIIPDIAAQLPRGKVADAHRMMSSRTTSGRVVLLGEGQ